MLQVLRFGHEVLLSPYKTRQPPLPAWPPAARSQFLGAVVLALPFEVAGVPHARWLTVGSL